MQELIKFIMVESKNDILNRENHVTSIINELEKLKLISNCAINSDFDKNFPNPETSLDKYSVKCILDNTYVGIICFEFASFDNSKLLYISIESDTYDISCDKGYLEQLKSAIRTLLLKDWARCVWLKDTESEYLALSLYPNIYATENLFRQLINEVLIRNYGIEWWEQYVPVKIKNKRHERIRDYKAIAPTLRSVDERLLMVDVGDLLDICQLTKKKWNPQYCPKIESLILDPDSTMENVRSAFSSQIQIEKDFWSEHFSKYLPESFIKNFKEFEKNRNHIAHNKLIDKQAYKAIFESIEKVNNLLSKGLEKFYEDNVSLEKEKAQTIWNKVLERTIIKDEARIDFLTQDEIYLLFQEKLCELYETVKDELRFRADLEFSEYEGFDDIEDKQELFSIVYKINDSKMVVSTVIKVDASPGISSEVVLIVSLFEKQGRQEQDGKIKGKILNQYSITYINGEAVCDPETKLYMPITNSEFSEEELSKAIDGIIDLIDSEFENLIELAKAVEYENVKHGGGEGVYADECCCECGEMFICIDESLAAFGQCLKCGAANDIVMCERCGSYVEGIEKDDELFICEACMDYYMKD